MSVLQRIIDIKEDLEMLGFDQLTKQCAELEKAYLKEREPKRLTKAAIKKTSVKAGFLLEITEGGSTYTLPFDTDAKAEAFLKKKQKERKLKIDLFLKSEGLTPPGGYYKDHYGMTREAFAAEQQKYRELMKSRGLDFEVLIKSKKN